MRPSSRTTTLNILFYLTTFLFTGFCYAADMGSSPGTTTNGRHLWREPVTGMEFIWLPGECFKMGQAGSEKRQLEKEAGQERYNKFYADETPQHQVCLSGFWLARHEVTRQQWFRLMDTVPFPGGRSNDHPATNISWDMANELIKTLNGKNKQTSFRLPTEAEMEYAIRAGTETQFYTGMTIATDQANFNGYYIYGDGLRGVFHEKPLPAGSYPPNKFGLFDMHGNVWEWCSDWYDKNYYINSPADNPQGPATGSLKVMRGGSWYTSPRSLRSANRHGVASHTALDDYGMRLVAIHPPPTRKDVGFDPDF